MPVESFRKKLEMAKDSRVEASSRRSENSTAFILNWLCFKWITFMTRRWQLPLWFLLFSLSIRPSYGPSSLQFSLPSFPFRNAWYSGYYCLARVFQNLPAPPKHYGVFDVFRDSQSFFQLENLGSHLAMCPDDRFLPQGKQILPEICQMRPKVSGKFAPLVFCLFVCFCFFHKLCVHDSWILDRIWKKQFSGVL